MSNPAKIAVTGPGAVGVAVREPEEKWEQARLDTEHENQQQREPSPNTGRQFGDALSEVGHVDSARRCVEQCERCDEHRRRHQADHHVRHPSTHLIGSPAQRQQNETCGKHHLKRYEEVEHVAGHETGRNACGEHEVDRVEGQMVVFDTALADCVDQDDQQHQRRCDQHDRRQAVDDVGDAKGSSPAARVHLHHIVFLDLYEQRNRNANRSNERRQRYSSLNDMEAYENHCERCSEQRNDDRQRDERAVHN